MDAPTESGAIIQKHPSFMIKQITIINKDKKAKANITPHALLTLSGSPILHQLHATAADAVPWAHVMKLVFENVWPPLVMSGQH
jgi:hypothetical protein